MTNSIGVHFQVFTAAWRGDERRRTAERAAAAGFDFVEVMVMDPEDFDVEGSLAAVASTGLGLVCSTAMRFESDLSSADPEVSRRGEVHMRRILEVASRMDAPWVVGATYGAWGRYPAVPTEAGRSNCIEALTRLAGRADELGVSIGMEVLNRFESNVLNTTAQARGIVNAVGSPRLRIHYDSYHGHLEERGQSQAVADCGGHLGYLHVGESHRGRLGTGGVAFDELFHAVADFDGPIAYEAFSANVVGEEVTSTLCVWQDRWDDSDEVAAHARGYIAEGLARARAAT